MLDAVDVADDDAELLIDVVTVEVSLLEAVVVSVDDAVETNVDVGVNDWVDDAVVVTVAKKA